MKKIGLAVAITVGVLSCQPAKDNSLRSQINNVSEETVQVSSDAIPLDHNYDSLLTMVVPKEGLDVLSFVHGSELAKQLAKEKFDFLQESSFTKVLSEIHKGELQTPALQECRQALLDIALRNGKKLEDLSGEDKLQAEKNIAFISYNMLVNAPEIGRLDWGKFKEGLQQQWGKDKSTVKEEELETYYKNKYYFNKRLNDSFLAVNKIKPGVKTTSSGLQYRIIENGNSESFPLENQEVEVHYRGRLLNGSEFDSSYKNGRSISFNLSRVIPGWTEGIQLMSAGSTYRFYIPYDLAYGAQGFEPQIPAFSLLVFDVELIGIVEQ